MLAFSSKPLMSLPEEEEQLEIELTGEHTSHQLSFYRGRIPLRRVDDGHLDQTLDQGAHR